MIDPDELRQRLMSMVATTRERQMPEGPQQVDDFSAPVPQQRPNYTGVTLSPNQVHYVGDGHNHGTGDAQTENYKLLMQIAKASGIPHTNMGTVVHRNIAGTNTLSQHAHGNAFDIGGNRANLIKMVNFLKQYAPHLKELIYTPTNTFLGTGGRRFNPRETTRKSHMGHIHVSSQNTAALQAILRALARR